MANRDFLANQNIDETNSLLDLVQNISPDTNEEVCPPQWGPVSTVFWAGRPSGPAGWLAQLLLKAGDVETNPGPKHSYRPWICGGIPPA